MLDCCATAIDETETCWLLFFFDYVSVELSECKSGFKCRCLRPIAVGAVVVAIIKD
jgi:hypothetical protein